MCVCGNLINIMIRAWHGDDEVEVRFVTKWHFATSCQERNAVPDMLQAPTHFKQPSSPSALGLVAWLTWSLGRLPGSGSASVSASASATAWDLGNEATGNEASTSSSSNRIERPVYVVILKFKFLYKYVHAHPTKTHSHTHVLGCVLYVCFCVAA